MGCRPGARRGGRAGSGRGGPAAHRARRAGLRLRHGRSGRARRSHLPGAEPGRRHAAHRPREELVRLHGRRPLGARGPAGRRGACRREPRHRAAGGADDQDRQRLHQRPRGTRGRALARRPGGRRPGPRAAAALPRAHSPGRGDPAGGDRHVRAARRALCGRAGRAHEPARARPARAAPRWPRAAPAGRDRPRHGAGPLQRTAHAPHHEPARAGADAPRLRQRRGRRGRAPAPGHLRRLARRRRPRARPLHPQPRCPPAHGDQRHGARRRRGLHPGRRAGGAGVSPDPAPARRPQARQGGVQGGDIHRPSRREAPGHPALRDRARGGEAGMMPEPRVRRGVGGGGPAVPGPRPRPVVVTCASGGEAEAFAADLRFFLGEPPGAGPLGRRVHHLPAREVPPFEALSPAREAVAARLEGFYHLVHTPAPIVVTSAEAWIERCLPRATFAGAVTYVVAGEPLTPDGLAAGLVEWGYHRVPLVQDPGDLAVRGGLLDAFPAGYERPVRLEFAGDTVESIRAFDPSSQRSLERVEDVLLLPIRELGLSRLGAAAARLVDARAAELGLARQERRDLVEAVRSQLVLPGTEQLLPYLYEEPGTLADYLPAGTLLWMQGAGAVEAAVETAWVQIEAHAAEAVREARFHPPPERLYLPAAAWRALLGGRPRVEVEALEVLDGDALHATTYATEGLALRTAPGAEGPLGAVAARLRDWQREDVRPVLVATTESQRDRAVALLAGHGLALTPTRASFPQALSAPGRALLALVGELTRGVWLPADRLALVTEAEIFGERRQVRRGPRARPADFLSTLAELKPNDYVVHVDHGIGVYRGLRHMQVADTEGDYLHLEYAGGDRLYLPVDRINLVQRYVSADSAAPPLDKLGGTSWERVKAKTRESLLAMAQELVQVYAAREAHGRAAYRESDGLYAEFAARFPFEETPDQERAIDEVLADLGREKPMDRLICGDVGYGKTEVAMRAAWVAVLGGKQVAVLVPTTILAQQHLETFRARFAGHPVSVEMLSRFRSAAENKETLARLAAGRADVVIGPHRLLQKDVVFRSLGLLIVDEEHRFGVKAKERIRGLRPTVDGLTLTATPIPRTLNMALSGIRDLSVIETPPVDRLAIRTYVTRHDEAVIRDAVLREIARGGQVFFVHNRVENIDAVARRLAEVVPEARIAVAHGQMAERELERTMLDFMHGKTNLLR